MGAVSSAAVCKVVVDEMSISMDTLAERLDSPRKPVDAIVLNLCAQNVLRRNGAYVSPKDLPRAKQLAGEDGLPRGVGPIPGLSLPVIGSDTRAPAPAAPKPKRPGEESTPDQQALAQERVCHSSRGRLTR